MDEKSDEMSKTKGTEAASSSQLAASLMKSKVPAGKGDEKKEKISAASLMSYFWWACII